MRLHTHTKKIERDITGLAGALYVHVERRGGPDGPVHSVRFSHKSKDEGTLDNILTALGDTVTELLDDDQ